MNLKFTQEGGKRRANIVNQPIYAKFISHLQK